MKLLSFKQFYLLQESFRSQYFSISILNLLFIDDMYDSSYMLIENLFPISNDEKDIQILIKCTSILERNTIVESELFPAYEDYALTILNKLFCSNNDRNEMVKFLKQNITNTLNIDNIKRLFIKFHSHFIKSS